MQVQKTCIEDQKKIEMNSDTIDTVNLIRNDFNIFQSSEHFFLQANGLA